MTRRLPPLALPLGTLAILLAVTALDGTAVAARTAWGQAAATALTFGWWCVCWLHAPPRLRVLMVVGIFAATAGEALFSLGLGMYTYRLERIPAYVPPGHTLLLATVYLFVRRPLVRRHRAALTALFLALGAAYSVAWLLLRSDRYGFVCFLAFAALTAAVGRARLFFSAMYLLVAYLELSGTWFGAWRWPESLLGRFESIRSGNPPSGVAVFYVLFDISCLLLYAAARWTSFERWVSRKLHRRAAAAALRSGSLGPPG
jgi:hypothetical protein